jgi:hypothetical protein
MTVRYRRYGLNELRRYGNRFGGRLQSRWRTRRRSTAAGIGCLGLLFVLLCLALPCALCAWSLSAGGPLARLFGG